MPSALETSITRAAIKAVSNAVVTLNGVRDISGIYWSPHREDGAYSGHSPLFDCASEDVLGVSTNDRLELTVQDVRKDTPESKLFKIVDINDDGMGGVQLVLQEIN